MFEAVRIRLGTIAATLTDQPDGATFEATTRAAQIAMEECVDALAKLQYMLADERQRHRQVEPAFAIVG